MSEFTDKVRRFFHLSVPATIDEESKVIRTPAFAIPITDDLPLPPAEPIQGEIEVARDGDRAVVRVKLKKKVAKKPTKKPAKKRAKK